MTVLHLLIAVELQWGGSGKSQVQEVKDCHWSEFTTKVTTVHEGLKMFNNLTTTRWVFEWWVTQDFIDMSNINVLFTLTTYSQRLCCIFYFFFTKQVYSKLVVYSRNLEKTRLYCKLSSLIQSEKSREPLLQNIYGSINLIEVGNLIIKFYLPLSAKNILKFSMLVILKWMPSIFLVCLQWMLKVHCYLWLVKSSRQSPIQQTAAQVITRLTVKTGTQGEREEWRESEKWRGKERERPWARLSALA